MRDLKIQKTIESPEVELCKAHGVFRISGDSTMEDPAAFYEQIVQWLSEYAENPSPKMVFEFQMGQLNQSSLKMLLFVGQELKSIQIDGSIVAVSWQYPEANLQLKEIGQDLSYMTDLLFDFTAVTQLEERELEFA